MAPTDDWPAFSHAQCVGDLQVSGLESKALVRNTGGGTSQCCRMFPVAAAARVKGAALQVPLERRKPWHASRNGARVYLADVCVEGDYSSTRFASLALLGRTLSLTVDLSAAECGCNAAFYLVPMAHNRRPGQCNGDYCAPAPATMPGPRTRVHDVC
jgi:hypothetical protein